MAVSFRESLRFLTFFLFLDSFFYLKIKLRDTEGLLKDAEGSFFNGPDTFLNRIDIGVDDNHCIRMLIINCLDQLSDRAPGYDRITDNDVKGMGIDHFQCGRVIRGLFDGQYSQNYDQIAIYTSGGVRFGRKSIEMDFPGIGAKGKFESGASFYNPRPEGLLSRYLNRE